MLEISRISAEAYIHRLCTPNAKTKNDQNRHYIMSHKINDNIEVNVQLDEPITELINQHRQTIYQGNGRYSPKFNKQFQVLCLVPAPIHLEALML